MSKNILIRRALISLADKRGIIELANILHSQGIEILATGGTAELLKKNNLEVNEVSDFTGYPEIMQGRVKTLHPKIFAGILGRRDLDNEAMTKMSIPEIDLVIVNLYPFQHIIKNPQGHQLSDAIENIDIGGVSLIRAAAKNFSDVTVIVNPDDYQQLISLIQLNAGQVEYETRLEFAKKAFTYTAWYESIIANYFNTLNSTDFPDYYTLQLRKKNDLRYGENPHQKAALYVESSNDDLICVGTATQLQGKELSYNNLLDADTAFECVKSFMAPACAIIKHANPCGCALAEDLLSAYQKAYRTDPTSSYGGIIAFNREIDVITAEKILDTQFVEVVIAPKISPDALTLFSTKQNIRVIAMGNNSLEVKEWDLRRINHGLLVQDYDRTILHKDNLNVVTERMPSSEELDDLLFAFNVAKFVKSNAIVYAKNKATIGIGAGQMSRIDSAKFAAIKAENQGLSLIGSAMASDAFFPFADSVETAARLGITAIIQPGGSIRDQEVIAAANQYELAMIFTGLRHFRH